MGKKSTKILTFEIVRLKSERKPKSKMEESDPTHESLHNIRDVKIEAVEEVKKRILEE